MRIKWDIEKVNDFVRLNSECELLSTEYIRNKNKLTFNCKCGNVFETTFKEFIGRSDRGIPKRQCNECGKTIRVTMRTKTHSQFKKEVFELVKDEYLVLSEYATSREKILVKHNECGESFLMAPSDFLSGQRCPSCFGTPKKTTNEYVDEVERLVGGKYTVLGEYKGNKVKILTRHNECGNEWEITPNQFLRNVSCPKCAVVSKGELRVREYLEDINANFVEQYRIEDCRNKIPLPFDFAIFQNNELKVLIEYDGEQHFKPMRFNNADKKFKETIRNDKIKKDYCKDNNIELIEIPYAQFVIIECILNNVLI